MVTWINYEPTSGFGNGVITITADTLSDAEERVATLIAYNTHFGVTAETEIIQNYVIITALTFNNLTFISDIPASGGIADSGNCSFTLTAYYSDGTTKDITNEATVTGYLAVSSSTIETRHNVGTLTLTASYEGSSVNGSVVVYQEAYNYYLTEYLTFNIISGGVINWMNWVPREAKTISYSKDDGVTWTSITSTGGTPITVSSGDVVKFKGDNTKYSRNLFGGSAVFSVEGNIMSLIDSERFATATTLDSELAFNNLFAGCTGLTSAENLMLPATTLSYECYSFMFSECTSLTTPPKLPATTLTVNCYSNMFDRCTSLKSAPELPATSLATSCYESMFDRCVSLTTAPSILPATTLANNCYGHMFDGCTGLTTAPELPATALANSCYLAMFDGCTSLNYIKCLATDITASECTYAWVSGVASSGTFVKNPNMSSWPSGVNGIPENWTVQDNL